MYPTDSVLVKRGDVVRFDESMYKDHATTSFGSQTFSSIELSSMSEQGDDGFYKCVASLEVKEDGTVQEHVQN